MILKRVFVSCLICFFCSSASMENEGEVLELPLKRVSGYGSVQPGLNPLSWKKRAPDDPWFKSMPVVSGVPANWGSEYVQNYIMLDPIQFAHQSYRKGYLSADYYNETKKDWGEQLFANTVDRYIKCYVNVIYKKTSAGEIIYRVDQDNDSDFGDEKDYTAVKNILLKQDSLAALYAHTVRYERIANGKVLQDEIPLLLIRQGNALARNFPVHFEAKMAKITLEVSSSHHITLDFNPAILSLPTENSGALEEGDFFSIKGQTYKFLGVDRKKSALRIQIVHDNVVYASQVGFLSHPFDGHDHITKKKVQSSDFKGKYVYLDFWGTWCGPCLQELPTLKSVYEKIDTTRIRFVGIAVDSDSQSLDKVLSKEGISWPQIPVETMSDLIKNFNINKYPTSFLIDGMGKIVAKDIPPQSLLDTLNKYIQKH